MAVGQTKRIFVQLSQSMNDNHISNCLLAKASRMCDIFCLVKSVCSDFLIESSEMHFFVTFSLTLILTLSLAQLNEGSRTYIRTKFLRNQIYVHLNKMQNIIQRNIFKNSNEKKRVARRKSTETQPATYLLGEQIQVKKRI